MRRTVSRGNLPFLVKLIGVVNGLLGFDERKKLRAITFSKSCNRKRKSELIVASTLFCASKSANFSVKSRHDFFPIFSLYWVAIQQLPPEPLDDYNETTVMRYYNSYGEIVEEEDDSLCCKNIKALHHKFSPITNS